MEAGDFLCEREAEAAAGEVADAVVGAAEELRKQLRNLRRADPDPGVLDVDPTDDPGALSVRWFGNRYVLRVPGQRPFTGHEVRFARAIGAVLAARYRAILNPQLMVERADLFRGAIEDRLNRGDTRPSPGRPRPTRLRRERSCGLAFGFRNPEDHVCLAVPSDAYGRGVAWSGTARPRHGEHRSNRDPEPASESSRPQWDPTPSRRWRSGPA